MFSVQGIQRILGHSGQWDASIEGQFQDKRQEQSCWYNWSLWSLHTEQSLVNIEVHSTQITAQVKGHRLISGREANAFHC